MYILPPEHLVSLIGPLANKGVGRPHSTRPPAAVGAVLLDHPGLSDALGHLLVVVGGGKVRVVALQVIEAGEVLVGREGAAGGEGEDQFGARGQERDRDGTHLMESMARRTGMASRRKRGSLVCEGDRKSAQPLLGVEGVHSPRAIP